MNSSAISLISQQGEVDMSTLMEQCDFMDPFDEEDYLAAPPKYDDFFHNYEPLLSSSTSLMGQPQHYIMPPNNYSNFSTIRDNMGIINFDEHAQRINPGDEEAVVGVPQVARRKLKYNNAIRSEDSRVQPTKKKRIRPPSQTYDHIMAERRRREQLSQLFVALSALIPGLKKMDKGSILEDAIKYTKELQHRVKMLEQNSERKAMESIVTVKVSKIVDDDSEGSSSEEERCLPEIDAKVNDNQILVKVLCEKQKDALPKLICKVESLNLMVISTNATSFGDVTLDITIVAEMEKDFNLSVKEVVTALRAAIQPAA